MSPAVLELQTNAGGPISLVKDEGPHPARLPVAIREVRRSTLLPPRIEMFGIPLMIHARGEVVEIESPQWPTLRAIGSSTKEAIESVRSLIRDDIEEFVRSDSSELSQDAVEYRDFLIGCLQK